MNPLPTPFCTMKSVGTLCVAISGSLQIVIIPRTTITIISALITKPIPILFPASSGFLNTFACWTNTATFASWKVPYTNAEYNAFPNGRCACDILFAVSAIAPDPAIIFGIYTISSPIMMQTDSTDATRLTRFVPNIATIKINTPMISVQIRYGSPVSALNVAPPVANATAGATHITHRYNSSNKFENTGAYFP